MSNVAGKDDNGLPVVYGVSDLDGITPVQIQFNPSTRAMEVDTTTSISFDPTVVVNQNSTEYPLAKGTSSSDNATILPWVVNHSTGGVLISTT